MTDQQPYTPTTEQARDGYSRKPPGHAVLRARERQAAEFDRWLATVEAAAEQRVAERAWVEGVLYAHERHNNHAGLSPSWKFDNPYRADLLEGDDVT